MEQTVTSMPNNNVVPLYGCVAGITLPLETFVVASGITLRSGVFEIFSSPMLAFKEAPPGSHTPTPWVAVHGGFAFKSRAELAIEDLSAFDGLSASRCAWLIATLLRLRIDAPIRIVAVANVPLAKLPARPEAFAHAFEAAPRQLGTFRSPRAHLTDRDLDWVSKMLPVAARLLEDERFMRAINVFDACIWSADVELGAVFLWTAIEVLLNVSSARHKTRAICSALAEQVAHDGPGRDRAYAVIKDLYEKRGRIIHSGRDIESQDFIQSFALVRAAFVNVLETGELPNSGADTLQ
jgi:hypothetical protein